MRVQLIDATHALNRSAGVSYFKVFLGRSFKRFKVRAHGRLSIESDPVGYLDFDKTVELIQANAKAQGWVVPKVYDFQKSLIKNKQPDPGKVKIIKVCHPEYAGALLLEDDSKFVAAMMPCSIAVYEKSDGKVYVSTMNMGLMSKMFTGVVGDTLAKVARDDAKTLEFLKK